MSPLMLACHNWNYPAGSRNPPQNWRIRIPRTYFTKIKFVVVLFFSIMRTKMNRNLLLNVQNCFGGSS